MARSEADIEQLRLRAARSLPAHCFDDFQRLSRTLLHGPAFQWLLVDAPHEGLRHQVMAALDGVLAKAGWQVNRLPLSGRIDDVPALEARLINNAGKAQVVHVIGRPGWFTAARWDAFNARRERVAEQARARLVFWLDGPAIELASQGAPDLWAWRAGVYAFKPEAEARPAAAAEARLSQSPRLQGADTRSATERHRRMAEIRDWLQTHSDAPDDLRAGPADELGRLLYEAGEFDEAVDHWRQVELPLHRRRRDERSAAITLGQIAETLRARGQIDEALRIRLEEQLPIFERLDDARAKASAMGEIADIMQDRGQLDEALRIYREEELPVYERMGDVRERAVTQGKIADILQARGQLDEALRIFQQEALPIFERLGDLHAKAVTIGRIASIQRTRGQLDEALRILKDEELPIYARLGDVHAKAVTMGRIADILQARGQFDEALRIRQEEELPVYERLGEVREKAVTLSKIAFQLLKQPPADRERVQALLDSAYADLSAMRLPEASMLLRQMTEAGLRPPATPKRAG